MAMVEASPWVKATFIFWVIPFIFIETVRDSIWARWGRLFRSSAGRQHAPQRLERKPG